MAAAFDLIDPITRGVYTLPIVSLPCCGQNLGGESIAYLGKWLEGGYENPCPFCRGAVSKLTRNKALEAAVESAARSTGVLPVLGGGAAVGTLSHLQSQADDGDALAQFNLGVIFKKGRVLPQDDARAATWFRKAADQGLADAQYQLGQMYEAGQGVEQNNREAVGWYRKAAEQGYAAAQCDLGLMYAEGRGVDEPDNREAVGWYRKAAEQGYAAAQFNLGRSYEKGRGVETDNREAVGWYRKAAEQGFALAQYILDLMSGRTHDTFLDTLLR